MILFGEEKHAKVRHETKDSWDGWYGGWKLVETDGLRWMILHGKVCIAKQIRS